MAVAPISDDSAQNAPRLALAAGAAVLRADAARVALARLDAALLAVLALEGPTSRQRLLHLLWPDEEPENARNALRQRLFRLRRAVGTELVAGGELLSLARGVEHDVDADADGLLLGAHDYADCPAFEQWLDAQRGMIAGAAASATVRASTPASATAATRKAPRWRSGSSPRTRSTKPPCSG